MAGGWAVRCGDWPPRWHLGAAARFLPARAAGGGRRLPPGSDPRTTKMLTRALVRASRAPPRDLDACMAHMRVQRAGERRSGRLRGWGDCAQHAQGGPGGEDRCGAATCGAATGGGTCRPRQAAAPVDNLGGA